MDKKMDTLEEIALKLFITSYDYASEEVDYRSDAIECFKAAEKFLIVYAEYANNESKIPTAYFKNHSSDFFKVLPSSQELKTTNPDLNKYKTDLDQYRIDDGDEVNVIIKDGV